MRKQQVPDADARAELVRRAEKLVAVYQESVASAGGAYGKGQVLDGTIQRDKLSDEAKRILPKTLDLATAERIAWYKGPKLIEWASDPETEGRPVPDEYAEIMKLIDSL